MNKNTGLAIVAVSQFQGKEAQADVNGLNPIYLTPIAGRCPNRNVLSGTVAKSAGFEEGKSYLAKWTRLEDDPDYGVQYGWTKVQEISDPLAVINAEEKLGAGLIFNADSSTHEEVTADMTGANSQNG